MLFPGSWAFLCLWLNICSSQLSGDIKRRVRFNFGVFISSSIWNVCSPLLSALEGTSGKHCSQSLSPLCRITITNVVPTFTFTQSDRESGVKDSWQLNFMPALQSCLFNCSLSSILSTVYCSQAVICSTVNCLTSKNPFQDNIGKAEQRYVCLSVSHRWSSRTPLCLILQPDSQELNRSYSHLRVMAGKSTESQIFVGLK